MEERTTIHGTVKMWFAARHVVQVVILSLGITTLTAGTASSTPAHVTAGGSGGAVMCSVPMDGDEQSLVPPQHNRRLPFRPY